MNQAELTDTLNLDHWRKSKGEPSMPTLTDSQHIALIALREEAMRMAREADGSYEDGRTTEADAVMAPLEFGETQLDRLESIFDHWWNWGGEGPNASEWNLRAKRNRDECRGLRRWIEGAL